MPALHQPPFIEGRDYQIDPITGCWNWKHGKTSLGYAVAYNDNHRPYYAHRFMYEQKYGRIIEGKEPDHTCKNPSCINPDHLEPVTHAENIRRAKSHLTWDDVNEIRRLYAQGHTLQRELGKMFGVTAVAIHYITSGKRWSKA
jgi:hypothetical protein